MGFVNEDSVDGVSESGLGASLSSEALEVSDALRRSLRPARRSPASLGAPVAKRTRSGST